MASTSPVTRSAAALEMDTPFQILIRPSKADPEKLGVWCKELIKEGTKFGPILGEKAYEVDECTDPAYIWEIVDVETKEFLFYINATKDSGNWMRHIKCARFFEEQNIVSEQEGIDIFYQAIKDISPGEELLTWFEKSPLRRKKGKRRVYQPLKRGKAEKKPQNSQPPAGSSKADAYAGVNCISQRGRKRNVRKYWQMEDDSDANRDKEKPEESEDDLAKDLSDEDQKAAEVKPLGKTAENPVEEPSPEESSTGFFQFELRVTQMGRNRLGRKVFQCDICSGIYRHGFSLKRHYIRNHINYKYVSQVDRLNCGITSDPRLRPEIEGSLGEGVKVDGVKIEERAEEEPEEEEEEDQVTKSQMASNSLKTEYDARTDGKIPDGDGTGAANAEHSRAENGDVTAKDKTRPSPCSSPSVNGAVKVDGREDSIESKRRFLLPGLYQCNICDKLYNTVDQLIDHILSHPKVPNKEKFACQHCSMKFKYRQNLMRHEVVHTGAKPYTCNHCNKRFPTLTNQKRHERIHKGQKFTCSQCPGTFTQTGDLKKHMCTQHPETYHECGYCAKYFSSESVLAGHLQKVHSKDIGANHQKICARRKAHKAGLERDRAESRRLASSQAEGHRSGSSDASLQFACTVCRKRFRDYSNMCRHRRLAHEREASRLESQWGSLDDGILDDGGGGYFSDTDSQPDGDKADALQVYFSGVSHNISNNLRNFIEGREEQLSSASSHIRWKQKNAAETEITSADINLEEFNFPHGFQIRQLSELYEASATKTMQTLDDETSPKNVPTCNNKCNGHLATDTGIKSESRAIAKDDPLTKEKPFAAPLAIRVPEIRSCSECHSSFHSTAALLSHMSENHCQSKSDISDLSGDNAGDCAAVNYSIRCQQPSDTPVQVVDLPGGDEAPLDLSVPSTPDTAAIRPALVSADSNNVGKTAIEGDEKIWCDAEKGAPTTPDKKYLCLVCFLEFVRLADLSEHQRERHASVDCRHAEVDLNFNTTLFRRPTPVGALNVSSSQLPKLQEDQSSADSSCVCTKCRSQFCSSELLHEHIADCGDYWRHLNTRVTWVFVLRGSEVPVEKAVKKRGKFHWSNSPEESSRKQLQRMLLQQHVGDDAPPPGNSTGRGGRFGRSAARTKSLESADDDTADLRRCRWRHGHQSAYNPRRHVRRREMAELVDVQRCRGCGEEFKTILQLERHIPVCVEKNRIKDLHSERAENGENSHEENDYDPNKHMCIYCERQFTYLRTLKKHIADSCPVRKEFVEKREYIDKEWEQEISSKVQGGGGSRDSGQAFGETVAGDEGDSGMDSKCSKRRKRGNNWGCRAKTKKSFKSSRSSDDGDSLFGWEDAFLSTWSKKEGNHLKVNSGSIVGRNNKGENFHDVQKPGGEALCENVNPNVDVSPALQKLLTSDFLSGAEEKPTSSSEESKICPADGTSVSDVEPKPASPGSREVNDRESSPRQQDICKDSGSDVACSEKLKTADVDASTANAEHVIVTEIQAEETESTVSDCVHDSDAVVHSSAVSIEEAIANTDNTDSQNEIDCNNFEEKELEQEQEEVFSVRARKRRGPRLTMKTRKRKPVVNEQKMKAQNN